MRTRPFANPWGAGVVCAAWLLASAAPSGAGVAAATPPVGGGSPRVEAAALMARSLESLRGLRRAKGLPIDRELDPNGTGIIGDEFTPLTTSVGDLASKRTSANPAFAAVLVSYFQRAGLGRGDVVAVGASGSFPGFLLATLCAARALDLTPVVIYSIGASMYGANLPGFTFVDMLARLRADGLLPYRLAAVSAGGEQDRGGGVLFDEAGTALADEVRRSGLPVLGATSLSDSIRQRLRLYESAAGGRPIRCFVNIGGASANYGDTPASLALGPGLLTVVPPVPASPTRGLVFEFAARGIPVVHLLFVRGLARDAHVPFDPVPLPPVGEGEIYGGR